MRWGLGGAGSGKGQDPSGKGWRATDTAGRHGPRAQGPRATCKGERSLGHVTPTLGCVSSLQTPWILFASGLAR